MTRDGVPVGPELAALVARHARGERFNVRAECHRVEVTTKTFYKYLRRFKAEGVDGFYPRSRRPLRSPTKIGAAVEDVVVRARKELDEEGWDAGADSIGFWIQDHLDRWPPGQPVPSRVSINRILERRGMIERVPRRRPTRADRRFEADQPNSRWQMDGFETLLAEGTPAAVLQLTDDCSRMDVGLYAAPSENGDDAWDAFTIAAAEHGLPREFLTDNGPAFSGRRRGWISQFEANLHALGVHTLTSSVGHPQTCGKNERAHQTLQKWLAKQPTPRDLPELQALLDSYRDRHNNHRRRKHLDGLTPAERFNLGPLDGPGDTPMPFEAIVRTGKVSTSGCLGIDKHLVGVGRKHAGKDVAIFKQHHAVAVFADHELIAEFTLSGKRGYQRQRRHSVTEVE